MPRCCQGIPDGPCPYGRCDESVKSTIYDLFLCPLCERARENVQVPPRASEDADNATAKRGRKIKNVSLVNRAELQSNKSRDATTEPTADKAAPKDVQNDECEGNDDDEDNACPRCLLRVIGSKRCIKCDICQCIYHQKCIEIPVKVFDKLIANVSTTGWVCEDCKLAARSSYRRLEAAVTRLAEELAVVRSELAEIKSSRHPDLAIHGSGSRAPDDDNKADGRGARTLTTGGDQSADLVATADEVNVLRSELADIRQWMTTVPYTLPPPSAVNVVPVNSPQEPDRHISLVVHRTLKDAAKRKRNVIVIGMPEDPTTSDREQFVSLCESFLSTKPYVVSCKRLGETIEGRTRKLLVRLSTDETANDLLHCAHRLRHATDPTVSSIYINADLSPAEAKLAFEARRRRREQVSQRQGTGLNRNSDSDVARATRTLPPNNDQPDSDQPVSVNSNNNNNNNSDEATGNVVVAALTTPVSAAAGPDAENVGQPKCDHKPVSFQSL